MPARTVVAALARIVARCRAKSRSGGRIAPGVSPSLALRARSRSGDGGGYLGSASASSSSVHASPSSPTCASISSSLGRGRAANLANSLASSISARVRRTIGIPFLPVRIAQADDPAHPAALCIDAMQYQFSDDADGANTGFTIISSRVGAADRVLIYDDGSVTDEKGEWLGNIHHEI